MSDLGVRYKEVVREGNIITEREKGLLEQLELKDEQHDALVNQVKIDKKDHEALENEVEALKGKNESILKKLARLEKQEIEFLQTSHSHTNELEEAFFARDAALQKSASLQKQVYLLSEKLAAQPKQYQEKQEIAMQNMRTQFSLERKKLCDSGAKMEQLISTLQSDVDRAIREKRAAESELEKLTRHLPVESDRLTIALDELHLKLIASERERLDAVQRLESLQTTSKQELSRYELELHQSNETNELNHSRLKRVEKELEESSVNYY